MPTPRPADRMHNRFVCGIAAGNAGGKVAGLFELAQVLPRGGFCQAPMQVQLVVDLSCFGIGPLPAAPYNHRGLAKDSLQPRQSLTRVLVALDREREAFQ